MNDEMVDDTAYSQDGRRPRRRPTTRRTTAAGGGNGGASVSDHHQHQQQQDDDLIDSSGMVRHPSPPPQRSSRRLAAAAAAADADATAGATASAGPRKRKQSDSGATDAAAGEEALGSSASASNAATAAGLVVDTSASAVKTRKTSTSHSKHVTPSPAVAASSASSFGFDSPPRWKKQRRQQGSGRGGGGKVLTELNDDNDDEDEEYDDDNTAMESSLPPGVVNLYSGVDRTIHSRRSMMFATSSSSSANTRKSNVVRYDDQILPHSSFRLEANSTNSLSAEFIRSYGDDYLESLKERETPAVPYPVSENAKTHRRGPSSSRPKTTTTTTSSDPLTAATDALAQSQQQRSHHRSGVGSSQQSSSHSSGNTSDGSSSSLDDDDYETPPKRKSFIHPTTMLTLDGKVTKMVKKTNKSQLPVESGDFLMYQPELTPKMRAILIDWMIELSEHFHFTEATLHQAVTMVDMVLSCGPLGDDKDEDARDYEDYDEDDDDEEQDDDDANNESSRLTTCYYVARNRFQLLGVTCTWMACKLLEIDPPALTEVSYVSDHIYSGRQIKRMERRVCNALGFRFMSQPTPYQFLHEFLRASEEMEHPVGFYQLSLSQVRSDSTLSLSSTTVPNNTLSCMACFLLELGRMAYPPATRPPSQLVASAVYLARVTLGIRSPDRSKCTEGFWTPTLEHYTGYTKSELRETVHQIHMYQSVSESSNLKAAHTKYKARKFQKVALKTVPLEEALGF